MLRSRNLVAGWTSRCRGSSDALVHHRPNAAIRIGRMQSSSSSSSGNSTPKVTTSSSADSGNKALFQIPAPVALFALTLTPVVGYAFFRNRYGPSNQDVDDDIREHFLLRQQQEEDMGEMLSYSHHHVDDDIRQNFGTPAPKMGIRRNREMASQREAAFARVIQQAIDDDDGPGSSRSKSSSGSDDETYETGNFQEKIDALLKGGFGESGRTRMHAVNKKLYGTKEGVEEKKRVLADIEREAKKKKRLKRKRKKKKKQAELQQKQEELAEKEQLSAGVSRKEVAAAVGVTTLAAIAAGLLVGGGRRSS